MPTPFCFDHRFSHHPNQAQIFLLMLTIQKLFTQRLVLLTKRFDLFSLQNTNKKKRWVFYVEYIFLRLISINLIISKRFFNDVYLGKISLGGLHCKE